MIGFARRRELRRFAKTYAADAAWTPEGAVPVDALLALLMKAESARERDYLFTRFWAAYFHHRARRLAAEARDTLKET